MDISNQKGMKRSGLHSDFLTELQPAHCFLSAIIGKLG